MSQNRKVYRWQFPLRSLLIVALLAPPIIAGGYFVLRETSAPLWAVGLGVVQMAFWLAVLFFVVRRAVRSS